ncbi:hypothetical protein DAKH74_003860 [Maudiozyma humilis]|uniref:N-acetyltransferase domain-containing protein n=1 Tax=Maudiozyma humilis TaxID=51915 RepID=A0AAV5RQI8_MAUHU|nr:hypothetical protein DAKH74_003860 [Kazachstania humilis]
MRVNEFNQAIGEDMSHWESKPLPERITITGKTCTLVPLDLDVHGPQLFDSYTKIGDDRLWTYLAMGPFRDLDHYKQVFNDMQIGSTDVHFAIIDIKTGSAVGQFALKRNDPLNGVTEEGFVVFSPLLQRTLMATEAHYLLAKYVFDTLGYRRYEWQCVSLNKPSRSSAERLGFKYEGTHRNGAVVKGRNKDTVWLAMTDDDWKVGSLAFEKWLDESNFDEQGKQRARLQDIRESIVI